MKRDVARAYPKRGMKADLGFKSDPKFCGNGSVELDGVDQCLKAELSAALGDSFTIMGWAKREFSGSNSLDYLINAGSPSGAGNGISVSITNATSGILYFFDNATSVNSTNTVEYNEWFHFALTVSPGAGGVKLYKNGIDGTPSNTVAVDLSDVTLEIGRYLGVSHYFKGNLFDVRIYDETLTQSQIREVINNPARTIPTGLTSSDLIHRYLLETNSNDTGATGDNLTESNSPVYTVERAQLPRGLDLVRGSAQARCFTGRAVDFDGSADGFSSTATLNINTSGAKATLACWVNPDVSTSGNKTIVSNSVDTNNNQFTIYQNGTSFGVSAVYASGFTKVNHFADNQVNIGAWTFLCAVWDFDATSLTFYVNGVSFTDTPSTAIGSTNNTFEIGCREPAGSKSQFFDGQIASIKLFDTTLSQSQVRELYHNPEQVLPTGVSASNLRRYYPLADYNDTSATGGRYFQDMGTDGAPAEDKGSASMEFAQPVPCPQLGLQQSATRLHHPGASQGAAATITAPGTTVSLSAWIFWDQARTSYPIALGTVTSTTDSFNIRINSSGQVTLYQNAEYLSGFTITEGGWNHIVFATRSDSPYWRCWLNNSEASSPAVANITNITSTDCRLGMNSSSFGMGGIANDAAVWNTELGDSDVAALYNSGVQGMDVSTVQSGNLLGWWKFDDLSTFKDFSGNSANATVSGTFAAVSFPENASGSTLVGDFSLKRKGVSVLNPAMTNGLLGGGSTACKIPNDGTFDLNASKGFSACGFMRLQEVNVYTTIFSNTTYNTAGKRLTLGMFGGSNQFRFPDPGGTNRAINFGTHVNDSDWHHLAATMDFSTNTVKLFLDGVLSATNTSFTLGSVSGLGDIIIGGLRPSGQHQEGAVACVKLYQATLSDNEIKQIYNSDLRLIKGLANE